MESHQLRRRIRLSALLAAVSLATLLSSACVVTPARGYYVGGTVMVAPPPLREEVIGVAPAPGYFWVGGYWNWVGGQHVWVPGRWQAPRVGYRWVPHRWVREGGGWRLAQGHWER
jgi:hypothetical protein